ncbi:MAG: YggT family protein [Chlamydiia bacterium]
MLSWIEPLFRIFSYCIMFRIMLSWLPELRRYRFTYWLEQITNPYLNLFRNRIPLIGGTIDISPMVALFSLQAIQTALRYFLP